MKPVGWKSVASALVCAASLLGACSNIDLSAAKDLSQTGQAATGAFQTTYEAGDQGLARMAELGRLRGKLAGMDLPRLGPSAEQLARARKALDARIDVMKALKQAYVALNNLAAYGSRAEMVAALEGLRNAVSAAGAAFGGPPIGAAAGAAADVVVTVGGLLTEEAQKRMVYRASVAIQNDLVRFLAIAKRPDERQAIEDLVVPALRVRAAILKLMWQNRMISLAPLLQEYVQGSSFVMVAADNRTFTVDNPNANAVAQALFTENESELRRRFGIAYDKNAELIEKLIGEHRKLQVGQPISANQLRLYLDSVAEVLQKLQVLTKKLEEAKKL